MGAVYEIVMMEWGLDPLSVIDRWTDELLELMLDKLIERKRREAKAWGKSTSNPEPNKVEFQSFSSFASMIAAQK